MKQNDGHMRFLVDGMTCVSCENKIEQTLGNMSGIESVSARYATSEVDVRFQSDRISVEMIDEALKQADYPVLERVVLDIDLPGASPRDDSRTRRSTTRPQPGTHKPEQKKSLPVALGKLAGLLIALFALAMLINQVGGLNLFYAFPVAEAGMGLGMLFVIGLLTSVHCVAMCGGINLSQCARIPTGTGKRTSVDPMSMNSELPDASEKTGGNWQSVLRPGFLYHAGRVISYTVIGGLVGALGSVISFSGPAKGAVQLAAGVFMVIMGLNMLNLFPWLRRFNPRLPRFFAAKVNAGKTSSKSPLYVGLLNGLMPCGPLQAMQLYALSTGSAIQGALAMLMFSLGTVPLMFGLSVVSTWLTGRSRGRLLKASAVLVALLGIFMFSSGLSLAGIALPDPRVRASGTSADSTGAGAASGAGVAVIENGVQTVVIQLSSNRYAPITVQKGLPVRWIVQAEAGTINGCNNEIIVPAYDISKKLEPGDNAIEFTPEKSGTFAYSCWMGMIRSKITVVDDLAVPGDASSAPKTGAVGTAYQLPTGEVALAEVKGDVQEVRVKLSDTGVSPAIIVLQRGLPAVWTIEAAEIGDSNSILVFPTYNAQLDMVQGDNPVKLTPEEDFLFYAADNSFYAVVKVVDSLADADSDRIRTEAAAIEPRYPETVDASGLPNCCA